MEVGEAIENNQEGDKVNMLKKHYIHVSKCHHEITIVHN